MTFSLTENIIIAIAQSEVTDINKQKFIAELAKLLTFMYEEDRQEALAMYSRMFDESGDEQSLLQALVSPTRQAVVIARAYNAKERKLQVHAQSRDEGVSSNEDSEFVRAINQVRANALGEQAVKPQVDENQLNLFDDVFGQEQEDISVPTEEDTPAEEPLVPAAEEAPEEVSADAEEKPVDAELPTLEAVSAEEPEETPAASDTDEDKPAEEAGLPAEVLDQVDSFLADFSLPDEVSDEVSSPATEEDFVQGELIEVTEAEELSFEDAPVLPSTVRKPKVFLLILYILLAIPLTLAGVVLLLVPTLLFLVLAAAAVSIGVVVFSAAFSGFAVFADMMVVLGAAVVVLALGLLFLWTFVWFIGGAIVGLIRGVVELGENWCYKEVSAE